MKRLLFMLFLFGLVSGCTNNQKGPWFLPQADPTIIKKETQVEVFVNPHEVAADESVETVLWEEAVKKGVFKISNSILQDRPLIRCTDQNFRIQEKYVQKKGSFQAVKDPVTNDYSQKFNVSAELIPSRHLAGKISFIEDKRNYAGQSDFVSITFFYPQHKAEGYFMVAKRAPHNAEENYLQLIGSGRLFRSLEHTGQAELLETYHEVRLDDFALMLQVTVKPVAEKKDSPAESSMQSSDEIVVEPEWEPEDETVSQPAESK